MKKQTLTRLALAGAAWWILKKDRRASGSDVLDNAEEPLIAPSRDRVGMMTDAPVSLENIRKGIARGWYKAQLCTIDGKPAVKLTGTANGKPYSDYYPISEEDYKTLQNEGVQPIGRCGVGTTDGAYSLRDWSRDGRFNPRVGQYITGAVFERLLGSVPPKYYDGDLFQLGEASKHDEEGTALYRSFAYFRRAPWQWLYLGLKPDYHDYGRWNPKYRD